MNNKSYRDELDRHFQVLNCLEFPERTIFKSNLTKARAKLKHGAFIDLNEHPVHNYYDNFQIETWHGYNLPAVDGSTLRVPDKKEIAEHFGVWNSAKGEKPCPKAGVSQMFDVLNRITVDAIISPIHDGENELAAFHFLKLQRGDPILLDRGYPAYWLFKPALSSDAQFCARISYKKWKIVRKFYKSGKKEQIVRLESSSLSRKKCAEMGPDIKPLTVRLIRIEPETGETEVPVTSLTDTKTYPHEIFADLYHMRWPAEEDCKTLKYRIQIENFSGRTVHSVYQDFHAKLFSKNPAAVIASTVRDEVKKKSEHLKYVHQINFAQAVSKMKNTIVLLFNRTHEKIIVIIEKIRKIFIQTTESVRPGRKFSRRHRVKQQRFFLEYKTFA